MSCRRIQIKWIKEDRVDIVPLSWIATKINAGTEMKAGSIVYVKYDSEFHEAEILDVNPPKRRHFMESLSEDSDYDLALSETEPFSPLSMPPDAASLQENLASEPVSPPPSVKPEPASPHPIATLEPAWPYPTATPKSASPHPTATSKPSSPPPPATTEPLSHLPAELLALPGLLTTLINKQTFLEDSIAQLSKKLEYTNRLQMKLLEYIRAKDAPPTSRPTRSSTTSRFLDGSTSDIIIIGGESSQASMSRAAYEDKLLMSTSGRHFVLKLVGHLFQDEELMLSNVNGGPTRTAQGIILKRALIDDERYQAILIQAEKEFPGDTVGIGMRAIRDAVNNKCKKAGHKVGGTSVA